MTKTPPAILETEVTSIREHLTSLLHELDRRRRELMDWKLQARRHKNKLIIAGAVLGLVATAVLRQRARHRARVGPHAAPREQSIFGKVIGAALAAAMSTAAKKAVEHMFRMSKSESALTR